MKMPEILRVEGATRVLGRSQGYYGLPVRDEALNLGDLPQMLEMPFNDSVTGPGTPTMLTAWQLTPDELARLQAGAPLYLRIVGNGHPPVMIYVGDEPPNMLPNGLPDRLTASDASRREYGPINVFVDDKPVPWVLSYDVPNGIVIVQKCDADDRPVMIGDGFATETIRGAVRVERKETE